MVPAWGSTNAVALYTIPPILKVKTTCVAVPFVATELPVTVLTPGLVCPHAPFKAKVLFISFQAMACTWDPLAERALPFWVRIVSTRTTLPIGGSLVLGAGYTEDVSVSSHAPAKSFCGAFGGLFTDPLPWPPLPQPVIRATASANPKVNHFPVFIRRSPNSDDRDTRGVTRPSYCRTRPSALEVDEESQAQEWKGWSHGHDGPKHGSCRSVIGSAN